MSTKKTFLNKTFGDIFRQLLAKEYEATNK